MELLTNFKKNIWVLLTLILSVILYIIFAYDLDRANFQKLIFIYISLFLSFIFLVKSKKISFNFLVSIAILFRLLFIVAMPNLSQDFYRFIWDGRMILEGFNPYLFTPESFISNNMFPVSQAKELYNGMGTMNASHYTNYPPINQLCFTIAGVFAGKSIWGSVIIMRLLIIMADLGTLYFGKKLLEKLNIPVRNIFWYILNPLIIIELTGNLHFESVMIFFLVWSLYLFHNGKWKFAAVILALSISVKLIPLLFLPLFFQKLTSKGKSQTFSFPKLIGFYSIVAIVTILLFLPFYSSELISNYSQTIGLYFQNFEFNGSLYYIAREIGYLFRGYNEIAIIGKIIPVLVLAFVLLLSFFRKNKTDKEFLAGLLFILSFYYFTATTMHPWYLATLVILSVFTKYRFILAWSLVIYLTYSAYRAGFKENFVLISIEYFIVYGFLILELSASRFFGFKEKFYKLIHNDAIF